MAIGIGDLGALANPFGVPSVGEWNLSEGIYFDTVTNRSVTFFYETKDPVRTEKTALEQISDTGGRRLAVYEYPYRDGQRIEDLGRKGERFSFNIKFFGSNYQSKFNEFIQGVAQSRNPGKVTHPVRGTIPARFQDYEFIHRHDESDAVTIRATFIEDSTAELANANLAPASQNSALRSALQTLTDVQSSVGSAIFQVGAVLLLPGAIKNAMNQRLTSVVGQVSRLLGQLAATFSTDAQTQALIAQSTTLPNGVAGLNSGSTASSTLPPVFQVGFSPTDQAAILAQLQAFLAANQVTTQQAVFNANQARTEIGKAIAEIRANYGNAGYDMELSYSQLAIEIQTSTEAAIAAAQSLVKVYVVPTAMSVRMIAFKNGLDRDRQNDIEALNPYLTSVNLVPGGTVVVVPAA